MNNEILTTETLLKEGEYVNKSGRIISINESQKDTECSRIKMDRYRKVMDILGGGIEKDKYSECLCKN